MTFYFDSKRWASDARNAMKSCGLSYRKLSRETTIGPSHLHSILSKKSEPRIGEMMSISNALDLCPIEYIDERGIQMKMFKNGEW